MKVIHTDNAPKAVGPYSQAIKAGDFLYVSGQLPIDSKTGEMVKGIKEQTEQSLKNAFAIIEEAGGSYKNVVKTTVFLQDINEFKDMNEVYEKCFKEHKPARAAFEVAKLPLGASVEIQMVAYLG